MNDACTGGSMKHIGWCLDKIQVTMGDIPVAVNSKEDREKANSILDEVQKYANTLAQLVLNPDFKTRLHTLEGNSIEGMSVQAHEIQEIFKGLEHVLYLIDLYIKNLKEILIYRPQEWSRKAIKAAGN